MTTITFDTHSFVKKLKAVGFTEEQADILASEQALLLEAANINMSPLNELAKRHADELSKYTYFLLATSATAIAYALQKLEGLNFSPSFIPVIIAVLAWAVSFYSGIKHLNLLKDHRAINANCLYQNVSAEVQNEKLDPLDNKAQCASESRFRFIVIGGAFYIIWRFVEMYNIS